jgi:hypothetical protein
MAVNERKLSKKGEVFFGAALHYPQNNFRLLRELANIIPD